MNVEMSEKMKAFALLRAREEAIRWSLYHYVQPSAGALPASINFFGLTVGQTDQFAAQVTEEDTNMEVANSLSAPNRMLVTSINIPIMPASGANTGISGTASISVSDDVEQLVKRGRFVFTLLKKPYLDLSPLGLLPAGFGVWASLASATPAAGTAMQNTVSSSSMPNPGNGYKVLLPLETLATFTASISFPKGTLTLANSIRFGVVLHGIMYRPEQ
jgi:hypothetical protein